MLSNFIMRFMPSTYAEIRYMGWKDHEDFMFKKIKFHYPEKEDEIINNLLA